jgi:hypothetical protein
MKSVEEMKLILDKDIFKHVNHGWRIATKSDTKCLMVKEKKAKGFLLIILLLLFIVPGIVYLFMYKGRSTVMIEVTQDGNIKYYVTGLSDHEKSELMWY